MAISNLAKGGHLCRIKERSCMYALNGCFACGRRLGGCIYDEIEEDTRVENAKDISDLQQRIRELENRR